MSTCSRCGQPFDIGDWPICMDSGGRHGHSRPHGRLSLLAVNRAERVVLGRNPATGEILYLGRNDAPIPPAFVAQGYETWEPTVGDLRKLEKQGIVNQALNYDSSAPVSSGVTTP